MKNDTPTPDSLALPAAEITALLEEALTALDLSTEIATCEAVREEWRTVTEALERAKREANEVGGRLREVGSKGVDKDAAAAAYLAGDAAEEVETEVSLRARSDALRAICAGLSARLDKLSQAEFAASHALRAKLGTAATGAVEELDATTARLLAELEAVRGAAHVIGAATQSTEAGGLMRRIDEALSGWAQGHGATPVPRTQEAPAWLLDALDRHAALITAGRGQILRHVTPPRAPREEPGRAAPDGGDEPLGKSFAGFGTGVSGVVGFATTRL